MACPDCAKHRDALTWIERNHQGGIALVARALSGDPPLTAEDLAIARRAIEIARKNAERSHAPPHIFDLDSHAWDERPKEDEHHDL